MILQSAIVDNGQPIIEPNVWSTTKARFCPNEQADMVRVIRRILYNHGSFLDNVRSKGNVVRADINAFDMRGIEHDRKILQITVEYVDREGW